jgi:hypothetical protein
VAHSLAHVVDHLIEGRLPDPRAASVPDFDKPHPLQVLHGLADRDASDFQAAHQLALGWKHVAGAKLTGADAGK